jgi:GAF domain-containing protein
MADPADLSQSQDVGDTPTRRPDTQPFSSQAAQRALIAETLDWCASHFGTARARFLRPLASGGWSVFTRQHDTLAQHDADEAEAAMAWNVGLSRQPLLVTRPRVSHLDGSGLRPIALTSYLGIPVVVQDRLVGVVECAGDVRSDIESALYTALPRLARFGSRLLYDPALQPRPAITPETIITANSEVWSSAPLTLTASELSLLMALDGTLSAATVAEAAGLDTDRALSLIETLLERGLVAVSGTSR